MSEFVKCQTKFKDLQALVDALVGMGWTRDQIETHEKGAHLYGYQGDKRTQTANVIIRRQHVGGASNDIGFVKNADGTYEGIISEYDSRAAIGMAKHTRGYNQAWLKELTQKYTESLYTREAVRKGYKVKRTVRGKKVELTLYR